MSADRRVFIERAVRALDDASAAVVGRAAEMLERESDAEEVIPVLIAAMRRRWHEPLAAARIVEALSRFAPAETRSVMADALAHESAIVRSAASLKRSRVT